MDELGNRFIEQDEYGQAFPCFQQALTVQEAFCKGNHSEVAQFLNGTVNKDYHLL
jgi:hypothetical protein